MIVPAPPMHEYDDTPMMVSVLYWKKKKKGEGGGSHARIQDFFRGGVQARQPENSLDKLFFPF